MIVSTTFEASVEPRTEAAKLQVKSVLIVALALRLLVLCSTMTYPAGWLFTRGMEMGFVADSLLHGQGFSSPFGGSTGPTAFIAPAYPILIAGVFRVFGSYTLASAIVVICAQILLNLLTIYLIMRGAKEFFGTRAANIAGFFSACSLPLLWMPTIFWETSISACLVASVPLLTLRVLKNPSRKNWIQAGIFCGLTGLINPALLPAVIAAFGWTAYRTRRTALFTPLLGLLTCAAVFSPWPIRNARAFHAFVPLRTTVGFELWMGNRPGASGFLEEPVFPMYNAQELADYKTLGEIGYTNQKSKLAMQYIENDPGQFVRLTLKRIVRFWTGTGTRGGSVFFPLHALLTTGFGLAGLWILARRRFAKLYLFIAPLALFPIPYYITHAEFRYRIVIDPLVTMLAGFAASQLAERLPVQNESLQDCACRQQ